MHASHILDKILLACLAGMMTFCVYADDSVMERPRIRLKAPDFQLQTIKTEPGGVEFHLSSLNGKLRLINFWSPDCLPCIREMPSLDKLAREYRAHGLQVITIAVNSNRDQLETYLQKNNWSFTMLVDTDRKVRKLYEVDVIPLTYLVGRDGRFIARVKGSRNWFSDRMRKQISLYLKIPGS